jgi:hypothetical protein
MTSNRFELQRLRATAAASMRRSTTVAAAVAAVLGALGAPVVMAQTESGNAGEIQTLRTQVQALQQALDRLQARQAETDAKAAAAAQSGPPPTTAVQGASLQSATPSSGVHAGPVTLTFGGYTELATIYRNHNETADVGSNFNTSIPYPNSPNEHLSEFRESARQSRITMLAQSPHDGPYVAEGYFEMDFLGAAPTANSVESNSYNLRMRNIYGTFADKNIGFYMLAGQSWSLVTLDSKGMEARQEQVPLTIDAQYVPGFNWTRNPQVRFVKEVGDAVSFGISLESPQGVVFNGPNKPLATTVFNNPGGSLFAPTNNYTTDVAPDVVAKVAFDPGYGHYELYGLGRWFRDRVAEQSLTTSGFGVGGGLILPIVPKVLDFQASVLAGNGIGRYGSSQLPDVTLDANGVLHTVQEYDALVGINYRPTPWWTLYSYVGTEHADAKDFSATVGGKVIGYGYGSPLYDNTGCLKEGATACAANTNSVGQATLGAWWKYYQGALGNLQFGIQGSYTKRKIFSGLGGNPDTSLTVGMLAFRFYPYQK